jgi:leucine dehydrogenase
MFALMQSTRTQSLHLFIDPPTGLKAVVAIHSEHLGPAMGGCRYLPYADDESAMTDAIRLAQGMSYKAALAGLPMGGGKAVIVRNPHVENRAALFEAFRPLHRHLAWALHHRRGQRHLDPRHGLHRPVHTPCHQHHCVRRPSPHAAMGVFAGIRATSMARLGSDNLEGLRVAVQGLGNVVTRWPSNCMRRVPSCWSATWMRAGAPGGGAAHAHPVTNDALISTPCDIFAPCGVGPVLNGQSVMQLRCAAWRAANNQLTTLQVADQLENRGILYAPDYVINAGGLIYVALKHRGEDLGTITAHLARIPTRLTEVFAHAQAEKRSPARVAQMLAERLLYG